MRRRSLRGPTPPEPTLVPPTAARSTAVSEKTTATAAAAAAATFLQSVLARRRYRLLFVFRARLTNFFSSPHLRVSRARLIPRIIWAYGYNLFSCVRFFHFYTRTAVKFDFVILVLKLFLLTFLNRLFLRINTPGASRISIV